MTEAREARLGTYAKLIDEKRARTLADSVDDGRGRKAYPHTLT